MKYKISMWRRSILAANVSLMALSASVAFAQEEATEETSADSAIEEVIVYGIRQSLESALAAKRARLNLTEIINADDIGKLPDENVAEVLENIAGVQITRDKGIGETVSIRGSDQNRIEINGRGTTPDGDGRGGISLSDLPAALVQSLEVIKVPTADMVEGSLGGTINVKTYRGLKLRKPLKKIRLKSEYAEKADAWNENFSATFGNKFEREGGDIGVILTVSHLDKDIRQDSLRITQAARGASSSQVDFNGDGLGDPYYYPGYNETTFQMESRKRSVIEGSLEWQASDSLKLFVEGMYADALRNSAGQKAKISMSGSTNEIQGLPAATFGTTEVAGTEVGIFTSGAIGGTPPDGSSPFLRTQSEAIIRDTQTYQFALGGEWGSDELEVNFEVSGSGSDTEKPYVVASFGYRDPAHAGFLDNSGALRIPLQYDALNGISAYGPADGAQSYSVTDGVITQYDLSTLMDPDYYSLYIVKDQQLAFSNDLLVEKVDFDWVMDGDFWTDLSFGLRASQRSNERNKTSEKTPFNTGLSAQDFIAAFPGFMVASPGDFFSFNSGGSYFDNFLTPDGNIVMDQREAIREFVSLNVNGVVDPASFFRVEEDTYAAYIKGDFSGIVSGGLMGGVEYSGNIGVRGVNTDQAATGTVQGEDISVKQNYTHWLPSLSLVFKPVDEVQVRLGYAKILRRPNFGQLSPTMYFPLDKTTPVVTGNPELEPTTANQFDVALEYYFRKGSALTLGYFSKHFDEVIGKETFPASACNTNAEQAEGDLFCDNFNGVPGVLVPQTKFVNLPGGKINGVELGFQHNFKSLPQPFDGLGLIANYAYQDGSRDAFIVKAGALAGSVNFTGLPLNFINLSKDSYNATIYFEKPRYRFSGRLRYTYRSDFLVSEASFLTGQLPLYKKGTGQLNASMSYRVNKKITVNFQGSNLTDEQVVQPAFFSEGPTAMTRDSGRRFSVGVAISL
jgi:iron complex outermembrane receptor protein